MVQYGSFAQERAGGVAPEETWAEMKGAGSGGQTKKSPMKYIFIAGLAVAVVAVVVMSAVYLGGNSSTKATSASEAAVSDSAKPSVKLAHHRLHLKTVMATPAIHWAQNFLIEQVAHWARSHPTEPGHEGMIHILQKNPEKYKPIVLSKVAEQLSNVQTCDANHVCSSNPTAIDIRAKVCPGGAPCSAEVIARIKQTAQWAAKIATDGAFHGLLQQMEHPAPAPLLHYGPSGGGTAAPSQPPPPAAWQSPGANKGW